jgi:hypothetical protein
VCGQEHKNVGGEEEADYSAHHDPFQFYASTANPHHVAPASETEVGHNGQANHQYDESYFHDSLKDGNLPSVSFVKQASTRTATPATPTRWTSRPASSTWSTRSSPPSTGAAPRSC